MTIWKYELRLTGNEWDLGLPVGYKILTIQNQVGKIQLWALVDPNEKQMVRVKIKCFGTGEGDILPNFKYLSTLQFMNGSLMLHFFCLTNESGDLIGC